MKLSQKQIFWFWLPLFASWLLMTLEGPITTATVSRLPDSFEMLAAYGIVISLSVFIESPIINLLATSTALIKDQSSYRLGRQFAFIVIFLLTLVTFAIGFTPFFHVIVDQILGAPQNISRWVRPGMQIMLFFTAAIGWRRFQQGVLINLDQGHRIAQGTGIRLVIMVVAILGLALATDLPGIHVGTISVMSGIIAESFFITWATRRSLHLLPTEADGPALTMNRLFWFHLPLAATSVMILIVQPIVTAALARLDNPEATLAAWPVLFQSLLILRAPGLSLPEVVIAKTKGPETWLPLRQFSLSMAVAMLVLTVGFVLTPASNLYFAGIQELDGNSVALIRQGLVWLTLFPAVWVLNAWLRGLLIRFDFTVAVNASMGVNLVITIIVLAIGVAMKAPGLETAAAALMLAAVGESLYQGWRLTVLLDGGWRLLAGRALSELKRAPV